MRKLVVGILGVLGLFVAGVIVFGRFSFSSGGKPPVDLATKPWVEHKFYRDRVALDVPWELKSKTSSSNNASSDMRMDTHKRDGVEVVISVSPASAESNLDVAMDRMTKLLREKPGTTALAHTRKEESVLGRRAIALYLAVQDRWRRKTDVRILFFSHEGRLYQVHCNNSMGDSTADKVWERMMKSIRLVKPPATTAEKISDDSESLLPKGMRRY